MKMDKHHQSSQSKLKNFVSQVCIYTDLGDLGDCIYAVQMQAASSYSQSFILQKHSAWAKTIAGQIAAKCFLLVLQEYFSHCSNKFLQ